MDTMSRAILKKMGTPYSLVLSLFAIIFAFSCTASRSAGVRTGADAPPLPEREFRAAWVATVANINWPSEPGLPAEQQKEEALALLDLLAEHHFNAVILQVRPQCDALYNSLHEPWSYYLSGTQGRAPVPYYDPLKFWIEEAHQRGLELHAWLNPYRAHHPSGGPVSDSSIVVKRPDLALQLANGYWWLDPSMEGTREHSTAVVMDIIRRYDVDGIHFDDYFYPYPSYNNDEDFPDDLSWQTYRRGGGKLSRSDWRREAVNSFIKNLYKKIRNERPHIKFGISPFGIWRPGNPTSIQGFDQYEVLYADARLWLQKGWIDYWTPQLYWPINRIPQSFPVLLGWWKRQNDKDRHLWPGIRLGRDSTGQAIDEMVNQIMITRGMLPDKPGAVHWSIGPLITTPGLADAALEGPYQKPALVPPSPWLDRRAPKAPQVETYLDQNTLLVEWSHQKENEVFRWVVYIQRGNSWSYRLMSKREASLKLPLSEGQITLETGTAEAAASPQVITQIAVSAVDRTGNESIVTKVRIKPGETAFSSMPAK